MSDTVTNDYIVYLKSYDDFRDAPYQNKCV